MGRLTNTRRNSSEPGHNGSRQDLRFTGAFSILDRELLRKIGLIVLLVILAVVIAMRYAEPILDGDLFWHFAYAKQMLEHHTLVLDHTLYSWTPVDGRNIYCAWLAELTLFGLWKLFGMTGIFILRYVVIAAIAGLLWSTIRRASFTLNQATLLVVLMLVVTAYPGSIQKPELFSLLFFHGVLWCYYRAKLAVRANEDPRLWLYAVPILTLIWANTHGAHVLLAPFIAATAIGEILTLRFSPGIAFPGRQLKHLLAAWALCVPAVCLTPYGLAYPLQSLTELSPWGKVRPDAVWNTANMSIYSQGATQFLSLSQIFILLATAVIVLFVVVARRRNKGDRFDYALALPLMAYLPLSVEIARASYLWPALACYALIYLAYLARLGQDAMKRPSPMSPLWRHRQLFATVAFAAVAFHSGYKAYARPHTGSWLGFGVSYQNPVPEAEYLASAKLGSRFYNTFDSGGYLLWRLYPEYRVMVDPRSFPYLDWFQDQYAFVYGTNFREFLARYPADLAIIDLNKTACWRNYIRASDWHLLFYGPTAAIFVHGPAPEGGHFEASAALRTLRNGETAFSVFDFSVVAGDYDTAWKTLTQLETTLVWQADADRLKRAQNYRAAHLALSRGDYSKAASLFDSALSNGVTADRDLLILSLLQSRRKLLDQGNTTAAKTVSDGLERLALKGVPER
jgi:hypothetical protein